MKTVAITRSENGSVSIVVNDGPPRTIINPNNLLVRPLPEGDGCIIKLSDETWRQTIYLSDGTTINGDPAPILLADLITVLTENVFAGSSTHHQPDGLAQTIEFDPPSTIPADSDPIELEATASSGLPVTFSSSDEAVFTVSGNILTPVAAGTANVIASQAGNDIYISADDVVSALTLT